MTEKVKFGVLGFGLFAEKYLVTGFEKCQYAELLSITKQNEEEAKQRAEVFGIPKAFSYQQKEEFLADPEIKAVYVAGPNFLHMQDTIDALKAGKHVIVEKPMAMNVTECEQMIAASEKYDRKLMVAHCFRYNTTVNYIKAIINEGTLGTLVTGTCDFLSDGTKSQRKWKYNKKIAGGGAAFDLGVHLIDALRYVSQQEITHASCIHHPQNASSEEVDSFASFLLEFEHDFVGRSTSSYLGSRNTFIEFFGTNGYIRAYDWNPPGKEVRLEMQLEGGVITTTSVKNEDQYNLMLDAFTDAILKDLPSPIPGDEGLKNQKIIDMVNE